MRIHVSGSTRKWHYRVQKPRDFCVKRGGSGSCGASENKRILPSAFLWGKHNLHFLAIHKWRPQVFWTFSSLLQDLPKTVLQCLHLEDQPSHLEVVCWSSLCLYSSEGTKSPWLFVHSVSERSYIFICPSLFAPNGVIIPPQVGRSPHARPAEGRNCSLGSPHTFRNGVWNIRKICGLSYLVMSECFERQSRQIYSSTCADALLKE